MPCTYWLPGEEEALDAKKAREAAESQRSKSAKQKADSDKMVNSLSVALDETSELLLELWHLLDGTVLNGESLDHLRDAVSAVEKRQIKHRQDDLDRLVGVLSREPAKNRDLLRTVLAADPRKPLEPQLGFNPDEY